MLSHALTLLAVASSALAATPTGFTPGSQTELVVEYGNLAIDGKVVQRSSVLSQPTIGLVARPQTSATSFAVIMIDLDIPTNNPPATNTLLHWMQTGLTLQTQATRLGQQSVFLLENRGNSTAALAPYIAPNPPARIPLSHRYTFILVDTSGIQTQATNALTTAAATRMGFNAQQVLTQAGLDQKVLAGNFFNVTNPGPVNSTSTGGGGGSSSGNGGATGRGSGPQSSSTDFAQAAGSIMTPQLMGIGALAGAAMLFMGL